MWYLRRYDPLLWNNKCCLDAVSLSQLSTEDNDISVWRVHDKNDMKDIALAIAMRLDEIREFFVVFLEQSEIDKLGLKMNPLPGDNRYRKLEEEHDNIIVPTFWEVGYLLEYMHFQLEAGKFIYFSEPELKDFFYDAVKDKRLDKEEILNNSSLKKYRKLLEKMEKDLP